MLVQRVSSLVVPTVLLTVTKFYGSVTKVPAFARLL